MPRRARQSSLKSVNKIYRQVSCRIFLSEIKYYHIMILAALSKLFLDNKAIETIRRYASYDALGNHNKKQGTEAHCTVVSLCGGRVQ